MSEIFNNFAQPIATVIASYVGLRFTEKAIVAKRRSNLNNIIKL